MARITVAFATHTVFPGASAPLPPFTTFALLLTGSVTSSALTGIIAGQVFIIEITQDSTGNRGFVWPTNFKDVGTIKETANSVSTQVFEFDGTNARALGATLWS